MKLNELLTEADDDFFTDKEDIVSWAQSAFALSRSVVTKNIVIHEDFSVTYNGNLTMNVIPNRGTTFKVKFKKVIGDFTIDDPVGLTSLKGCPEEITGFFNCSKNPIKTLAYGPKKVGAYYGAEGCGLTSFVGLPERLNNGLYLDNNELSSFDGPKMVVGGEVYLNNNKFTSLSGVEDKFQFELIVRPSMTLYVENNPITSSIIGCILTGMYDLGTLGDKSPFCKAARIMSKYLGKPDEIFECQTKLIDAGFEEFAKL